MKANPTQQQLQLIKTKENITKRQGEAKLEKSKLPEAQENESNHGQLVFVLNPSC